MPIFKLLLGLPRTGLGAGSDPFLFMADSRCGEEKRKERSQSRAYGFRTLSSTRAFARDLAPLMVDAWEDWDGVSPDAMPLKQQVRDNSRVLILILIPVRRPPQAQLNRSHAHTTLLTRRILHSCLSTRYYLTISRSSALAPRTQIIYRKSQSLNENHVLRVHFSRRMGCCVLLLILYSASEAACSSTSGHADRRTERVGL